jgi:hypothetical protein
MVFPDGSAMPGVVSRRPFSTTFPLYLCAREGNFLRRFVVDLCWIGSGILWVLYRVGSTTSCRRNAEGDAFSFRTFASFASLRITSLTGGHSADFGFGASFGTAVAPIGVFGTAPSKDEKKMSVE